MTLETPSHNTAEASALKPARLQPIIVTAHPGGLFPGIELAPTWFKGTQPALNIPSALPKPGDSAGINAGVRAMNLAIREAASSALALGHHPVLIGGDHSLAMGTLAASANHYGRLGVIWVDAHADFNTFKTSPTGNPHGMPLAVACGLGDSIFTGLFEHFVAPKHVVLIAARSIDEEETRLLESQGIWHISVAEFRSLGIPALIKAIHERLGDIPVHLSVDFDAISSEFFPATGTPEPEGLSPDEGAALLGALAKSPLQVVSNDWVEFDPRSVDAESCALIARRLYEAFHAQA
jgi:arginase